jgi:septal ring factor EnvC (AmiA/AmiB activator)
MSVNKWIYAFCLICFFNTLAFADSKLFVEKKRIEKDIENIKGILSTVDRDKKASLSYLSALKQQINVNKNLIDTLAKEIEGLNKSIKVRNNTIASLSKDIASLQREYANITYICAKTLDNVDKVLYVFSPGGLDSVQKLLQRVEYIKQYSQLRKMHFREIYNKITKVEREKIELSKQSAEKKALLKDLHLKRSELQKLQVQKKKIVNELNKKSTKLKDDLKRYNANLQKLDALIKQSIAKERSTKLEKNVKKSYDTVAFNFGSAKGKLPWPVKSGFISCGFGVTNHPIIKNITINNLGIDIQTKKREKAINIHKGVVKAIVQIPGMAFAIIIKHGNYYTVYARMENVVVKEGELVEPSKVLGNVACNDDGVAELHFQIWYKNQRLNPSTWLSKK